MPCPTTSSITDRSFSHPGRYLLAWGVSGSRQNPCSKSTGWSIRCTGNPVFDSRNDDDDDDNSGTTKVPSYESVCASREWVEAVRVQYDDDAVLSYPQLLEQVFEYKSHNRVLA